ncbi:MAG TPA: Gfo/Idh/MocA family oxidoreductase [Verrucomicrobiae bacterium]|nr:Gfo/Idh/MocA family oxidoreductase [Verrucomicrobiae bacterium]
MKTINIGVVGIGFMGVTHIKSYQKIPGARVAAICARHVPADGDLSGVVGNIGDGKPLKLDMTQVKAYSTLDELLKNPEIDVIDICVPTPQHPQLAIAALRAGRHVICEKPLARTPALCREIASVAAKSKGFFMPAMVMRFWPEWSWLKKTIDEKALGKVLAARFRRVCPPPGWGKANYFKGDDSGGALLDLHIHDTDFIQFCFGRPRSVFSIGGTRFSGAVDHVVTSYQFDSGVPVFAEASWFMADSYGFKMEYTVNFERATADFDSARGAEALRLHEEGQKTRAIQCGTEDGYILELRHMIESVQKGVPPTIVSVADAVSAVEICDAEERSVKTGAVVTL